MLRLPPVTSFGSWGYLMLCQGSGLGEWVGLVGVWSWPERSLMYFQGVTREIAWNGYYCLFHKLTP
jgi:hypothetical protein